MSEAVFDRILRSLCLSDVASGNISLLWHAGEPMSAPITFYQHAFEEVRRVSTSQNRFSHVMQTNATLVTDQWLRLLENYQVSVGVSLDGPAAIHDQHRVTRAGHGTHKAALRGLRKLQGRGFDPPVIAVLTRDSLNHPDELYQFFVEHNVRRVGFNVEEIEGAHSTTSLDAAGIEDSLYSFYRKLLDLQATVHDPLDIREITSALHVSDRLVNDDWNVINDNNVPGRILSFDIHGNFGTFSPELLSQASPERQRFIIGNVIETESIDDALQSDTFKNLAGEVASGVEACRRQCDYWAFCGGGAPSNKFAELKDLTGTETTACRLQRIVVARAVLDHLDLTPRIDGVPSKNSHGC